MRLFCQSVDRQRTIPCRGTVVDMAGLAARQRWPQKGVFFHTDNALSAAKGGWECTAQAKYAIYDCLVTEGDLHLISYTD